MSAEPRSCLTSRIPYMRTRTRCTINASYIFIDSHGFKIHRPQKNADLGDTVNLRALPFEPSLTTYPEKV